jgi:hypothetical protein
MKLEFLGIASIFLLINLVASREYADFSPDEKKQFDVAAKTIKSSFPKSASNNACGVFPCCNITSSEPCDITRMTVDTSTLVQPGGMTRCIFSTSTPYSFQVIPGAIDNLLVYFQRRRGMLG